MSIALPISKSLVSCTIFNKILIKYLHFKKLCTQLFFYGNGPVKRGRGKRRIKQLKAILKNTDQRMKIQYTIKRALYFLGRTKQIYKCFLSLNHFQAVTGKHSFIRYERYPETIQTNLSNSQSNNYENLHKQAF